LNNPKYAQEVLPYDLSHLLQFLEYAKKKSNKSGAYARSVLRLFTNKLKACPYVSAYALSDIILEMGELLTFQVKHDVKHDKNEVSRMLSDLLYSSFSNRFRQFKKSPRPFLTDLSQDIVSRMSEYFIPDNTVAELRTGVVRFFEVAMSKLIWHPEDGIRTWKLTKSIANRLEQLVDKGLLADDEELNDLYITLLERYIFFVDISSATLPLSFFEQIKKDIAQGSTLLLDLEEQEELLETKTQRFVHALGIGEAKCRAREKGHRVKV